MKGKTKAVIFTLAVLSIIVAIYFSTRGGNGGSVLSQLSVLSISTANYVSNDPEIGGPAWLITVVQDQKSDNLILNIDPSQLVDNNDNEKATRSATMSFAVDSMSANYAITYQNTNIRHMNYYTTSNPFNKDNCEKNTFSDGSNTGGTYYAWGKQGTSLTNYCFYTTNTAGYGLLSTPTTSFHSTVTLTTSNATYSTPISSLSSTVASIVDPVSKKTIGRVNWVGNLVSGEEAPKASDQKITAAYSFSSNGWKTINDQQYINYYTFDFFGCTGGVGTSIGTRDFEYCVNQWNTYEANALSGKSLVNSMGGAAQTSGSNLLSGQVVLPLSKQIQFPVMTIKLDASIVGTVSIQESVGKPVITNVNTNEFQTGSTGFLSVEVYNSGTGAGSFEAYATCNAPFSQSGTSQFLNVNSKQYGTTNIPITANVISETSGSCTVTVRDRNNPANTDSKTVTVKASPIILCTPSTSRCDGNLIEVCNPAGSGWATQQTCPYGCEVIGNVPTCKGVTPAPTPDKSKINWTIIIPILAGLIGFLIVGANDLKEKRWIGVAIAAVVGLVVGFILYWILTLPWYVKLFGGIGIVLIGLITAVVLILGTALIREIFRKKVIGA